MKIENITAKRTNSNFEVTLPELSAGFNVVLGNNDSGKSTTWEFLRDSLCSSARSEYLRRSICGTIGLRSGEKRAFATISATSSTPTENVPSTSGLEISTITKEAPSQAWQEEITRLQKPVFRNLFFANTWCNKSLTRLITAATNDGVELVASRNSNYIGDEALVNKLCPAPRAQNSNRQNREHQQLTLQLLNQQADQRRRITQIESRIKTLNHKLHETGIASQQKTKQLNALENEITLLRNNPVGRQQANSNSQRAIESQIHHISLVIADLESSKRDLAGQLRDHSVKTHQTSSPRAIEQDFANDLVERIRYAMTAEQQCTECGQQHQHVCQSKWTNVESIIKQHTQTLQSELTKHIATDCTCSIESELAEIDNTLKKLADRQSQLQKHLQLQTRNNQQPQYTTNSNSQTSKNEQTRDLETRRQQLISQIASTSNQQEQLRQSLRQLQNQLQAVKQSFSRDEMRKRLNTSYSLLTHSTQTIVEPNNRKSTTDRLNELKSTKQYPAVLADASIHLNQLTGGNFFAIRINPDNESIDCLHKSANWQAFDTLSVGTQQMATLALRLSIAKTYHERGIHFPLVCDNIFTDNDATRQTAAITLINDYCRNGFQVILLTCHPSIYEKAVSLGASGHHLSARYQKQTSGHKQTSAEPLPAPAVQPQPQSIPRRKPKFQRLHQEHLPHTDKLPNNPSLQEQSNKISQPETLRSSSPTDRNSPATLPTRQHLLSKKATNTSNSQRDYFASQAHQYNSQSVEKRENTKSAHLRADSAKRWNTEIAEKKADSRSNELSLDDSISRLSFLNQSQRHQLNSHGVTNIGQFLKIGDRTTHISRQMNISPAQLMRWQSAARLSYRVPGIRQSDAETLAMAGIDSAESLASTTPRELQRRITWVRSLRHSSDRTFEDRPDNEQFRRWIRSARYARPLAKEYRRSRRRNRSSNQSHNHTSRDHSFRNRRSTAANRQQTEQRNTSTSRQSFSRQTNIRPTIAKPTQDRTATIPKVNSSQNSESQYEVDLRYHLSQSAAVVDAPSIGPKTAKRLARAKIKTVADLLNADPETVAKKANVSSIKPETIREWQAQAKLACCIPEIRGHDAQFLVACRVDNATKLSPYNPSDLFRIINPFAKSKAGKRIARSGKLPDLAEVTDWIEWSKHARSIDAA